MRFTTSALLVAVPLVAATASSKRGLCVVSTSTTSDDAIWTNDTDLTWYYNYAAVPTPEYQNKLNFVPMLWGAPQDPANDMTFYNQVSNLIKGGQNITHVLGFNEPDGCGGGNYGGSCVSAATAAQVWKKQMEPLKRDFGIKLGAPAVTGAPTGFNWLANWFSECAALVASSGGSSNTTSCEVDFIPAHWYGDFGGLASHLGQINSTYQNISQTWVTEFACAGCSLEASQTMANQSFEYLDRISYMGKYSYFGAFRSSVSNVGPNAAFLTQKGQLTDIGALYLNKASTGAIPKGSASTVAKFAGWGGVVVASVFWSIL